MGTDCLHFVLRLPDTVCIRCIVRKNVLRANGFPSHSSKEANRLMGLILRVQGVGIGLLKFATHTMRRYGEFWIMPMLSAHTPAAWTLDVTAAVARPA